MNQNQLVSYAAAVVAMALSAQSFAASGTWTGATDANFATGTNWSTGTVPTAAANAGAADVATFSSTSANGTTIALPATVGLLSAASFGSTSGPTLAFDATSLAYTIGTTANGSNYVVANSGWNTAIAAGGASQVLNPTFVLANRSGTPGVTFSNNSITGSTFTINGNVTSQLSVAAVPPASSGWIITSSGVGTKIFNGIIGDTSTVGTGTVLKISAGPTALNNANTYFGGTQLNNGTAILGNKAALGTGAVSVIAANNTLSATTDLSGANAVANGVNYINGIYTTTFVTGSQNLELSGPIALNSNAGTTAYAANGGQTFNVTNTGLTTFSGTISGNGTNQVGFTKTGAGTLVLSGPNNTFGGASQGTAINGGTLLVNNAVGSGTGASGVVQVNSGGALGGNGIISGLIAVASGGSLRPGAATGNSTAVLTSTSTGNSALVLNAGSTSVFDINGTTKGAGYDNFTTAGKVTYGGDLTINLNAIAGGTTVYDLFAFATQGGVAFNSITIAGSDAGALTPTGSGNFSGSFNGGLDTISFAQLTGDLTVTAVVPEPALLGATAGAATLLLGRRRRGASAR